MTGMNPGSVCAADAGEVDILLTGTVLLLLPPSPVPVDGRPPARGARERTVGYIGDEQAAALKDANNVCIR